MEEVGKLEELMVPDSYQSDEECADLNSKSPSLFQCLIRRNVDNMINNENRVDVDNMINSENMVDVANMINSENKVDVDNVINSENKDDVDNVINSENKVDVDNVVNSENKVDVDNVVNSENKVDVDEGNEEAKEVDLEEKDEEFYMVWFDAFLAKHGLDKDYLDQSSLQQILKTWLQKKLTSAEFRFKEAEIDLNFINFRYAICKTWLSSL